MSTPTIMQAEPRRWAMFVILLVGAFLPPLDFFIVNVPRRMRHPAHPEWQAAQH